MNFVHRAALGRLREIRGGEANEAGFALAYVLAVVMIVTFVVTGMLVVSTNAISPTTTSLKSAKATAAAQAGVQAYVARLNASYPNGCSPVCVDLPTLTANVSGGVSASGPIAGVQGAGAAWYSAQASMKDATSIRIISTGCSAAFITGACPSGEVGKALVTDLRAPQSAADVNYYSTYETVGSDLLSQEYPARTVAMDPATKGPLLSAVGANTGIASVSWPTGATPGSTAPVCDSVWYDNPDLNKSGASNRHVALGAADGTGYDWAESGTTTGVVASANHLGTCQVAMTSANSFQGPVYTEDALLVVGNPTFTHAASLPAGTPDVLSGWTMGGDLQYRINSALYGPSAPQGDAAFSTGVVPRMPTTLVPKIVGSRCVYYGPTRVLMDGDGEGATITSPMTSGYRGGDIRPDAALCYTSDPSQTLTPSAVMYTTNASGAGVADPTALAPVTAAHLRFSTFPGGKAPTISVQNVCVASCSASNWGKATGDGANASGLPKSSIFTLTSTVPAIPVGGDTTNHPVPSAGTWGDPAGATLTQFNADSSAANVKRGNGTSPVGYTTWTAFKSTVPFPATTPATLISTLNNNLPFLSTQTTGGVVNGTPTSLTAWRYVAYVAGTDPNNKTTPSNSPPVGAGPAAGPNQDSLFAYANGTAQTNVSVTKSQTETKATVEKQAAVQDIPPGCTSGGWWDTTISKCWQKYDECVNTKSLGSYCAGDSLTGKDVLAALIAGLGLKADLACTAATCAPCAGQTTDPAIVWVGAAPTAGKTQSGVRCQGGPGQIGTFKWPTNGQTGGPTTPVGTVDDIVVTTNQNLYSWAGSPPTATFPQNLDRTVYNTFNALGTTGPGDVYVSGNTNDAMGIIAENDIVVTGSMCSTDPSGDGCSGNGTTALTAGQNVRIYHPVSCASNSAAKSATTAGFCPNDTTGLFKSGTLPASYSAAQHPSRMYADLPQDQIAGGGCSPVNIAGDVFALGVTASGGIIANGSFTTDNPDKGLDCGSAIVYGGVVQQHRGSLGTILEKAKPSDPDVTTGYSLHYMYDPVLRAKLDNAGVWYPEFTGIQGKGWAIVSTSSAAGP